MFTMCNATLNACWDTATARHHWTEQWRRDQVRWHPLPNRTEFINFSKRFLISDNSSFCSLILSAIDLQCHVFFLLESFCWMSVFVCKRHFWWCHIWRHRHVTMLQCSAKFPNILVHWSIWIIHAKNYETVTKFVKVMRRILWPLSFPDTVYSPETTEKCQLLAILVSSCCNWADLLASLVFLSIFNSFCKWDQMMNVNMIWLTNVTFLHNWI